MSPTHPCLTCTLVHTHKHTCMRTCMETHTHAHVWAYTLGPESSGQASDLGMQTHPSYTLAPVTRARSTAARTGTHRPFALHQGGAQRPLPTSPTAPYKVPLGSTLGPSTHLPTRPGTREPSGPPSPPPLPGVLRVRDSTCLVRSSVSLASCSMLLADSTWLKRQKQRVRAASGETGAAHAEDATRTPPAPCQCSAGGSRQRPRC